MQLLPWTAEREATLIKMWLEGLSGATIACELGGTTRNAVVGKAYRMMLKSENHPKTWKGPRKPPISGEQIAIRIEQARIKAKERNRIYRAKLLESDLTDLPDSLESATMLIDLRDFERQERRKLCRWPLGEPSASMVVCGAVAVDNGCSYCPRHFRMAYQPAREWTAANVAWMVR